MKVEISIKFPIILLYFSVVLLLSCSACNQSEDQISDSTWTPGTEEHVDPESGDTYYITRQPAAEDGALVSIVSGPDSTAVAIARVDQDKLELITIDHATGEITQHTNDVEYSTIYDLEDYLPS